MSMTFASDKKRMEIFRSFEDYQLLKNEDILNLDI